jgi:hypothetical protein
MGQMQSDDWESFHSETMLKVWGILSHFLNLYLICHFAVSYINENLNCSFKGNCCKVYKICNCAMLAVALELSHEVWKCLVRLYPNGKREAMQFLGHV